MDDNAVLRVNDEERQAVVVRLRDAVGAGYLELEEFSERVELALGAPDRGALAAITRDLPVTTNGTGSSPEPSKRKATTWILGIMGGGDRRGRWRVGERVMVLNLMGGADLDLRTASISAPVTTITVFSVMGGSTVTVPDGIDVELSGFAIMGGNGAKLTGPLPPAGAPLVRVRAYSIMGGTHVRSARPRLREERQARRELR